ncbi:MAG: hypothetical protein RBS48_00300 [Ignavibacteriaceae bacterium]|jgi:hypothetical protein|nr:hypothetical protein [Ignavibacteriaceae bacterium]
MNRSNTLYTIAAVFFVAIFIFIYVVLVTENKNNSRDYIKSIEMLNRKKNTIEMKKVEIQTLESEDRITSFAADSLNLIRSSELFEKITISKTQLKQIELVLKEKYE